MVDFIKKNQKVTDRENYFPRNIYVLSIRENNIPRNVFFFLGATAKSAKISAAKTTAAKIYSFKVLKVVLYIRHCNHGTVFVFYYVI